MNHQRWRYLMLVVLLEGLTPSSRGGADLQPQSVEPSAPLQTLAERLLAPPVVGPDGQRHTVRLLPGQLPSGLPLALPIPPQSHLVGSLLYSVEGKVMNASVVLDVPGAGAEVPALYQQALPGHGWQMRVQDLHAAPQRSATAHGFQPPSPPALEQLPLVFCHSPTGPWLSVATFPGATGFTDVRLM